MAAQNPGDNCLSVASFSRMVLVSLNCLLNLKSRACFNFDNCAMSYSLSSAAYSNKGELAGFRDPGQRGIDRRTLHLLHRQGKPVFVVKLGADHQRGDAGAGGTGKSQQSDNDTNTVDFHLNVPVVDRLVI